MILSCVGFLDEGSGVTPEPSGNKLNESAEQ